MGLSVETVILADLLTQAEELGRLEPPPYADDGRWAHIMGYEQALRDIASGQIKMPPT